ncbi:hypothetical protein NIES4071_03920 [Calothrix sp. NIES-4071]|nr:hypothetical protein NIES4071_03920 [Calothrix sp. NIES-4071]BAZ54738.1 hypothetical protein NIES4105_03910 [Calothrix sp. NIES-4105]
MCFSAEASFTASALLISTGLYCLRTAKAKTRMYLPFAAIPLVFGIQQALEGFVWIGTNSDSKNLVQLSSLGFLFFSHCFWLFWTPMSVSLIEEDASIKNICRFAAVIGVIFGTLLYIPFLINEQWFSVATQYGSIKYQTILIFDAFMPRNMSRLIYACITVIPLLIASEAKLKVLGGLLFCSFAFSYIVFEYAFVSIWCFWAALLSVYIGYITYCLSKQEIKSVL